MIWRVLERLQVMPDFVAQKCSVELKAGTQKASGQSASERQGEQRLPSPTQTPARGVQTP
jgi:hypothetical protein